MNLVYRLDWVFPVMVGLAGMIAIVAVAIVIRKRVLRAHYRQKVAFHRTLLDAVLDGSAKPLLASVAEQPFRSAWWLCEFQDQVQIPDDLQGWIRETLTDRKLADRLRRYATSRWIGRRMTAVRVARVVPEERLLGVMAQRVAEEPSTDVAYAAWFTLFSLDDPRAVRLLVDALRAQRGALVENALRIIERAGPRIRRAIAELPEGNDVAIRRVMLHAGAADGSGPLGEFVRHIVEGGEDELRPEAFEMLRRSSPKTIDRPEFFFDPDPSCRRCAIDAHYGLTENVDYRLVDQLLTDPQTRGDVVRTVAAALRRAPEQFAGAFERFRVTDDPVLREGYSAILRAGLVYVVNRYVRSDPITVEQILRDDLAEGRYSEIVDFVNRTRNADIERAMITILRPLVTDDEGFREYCSRYLEERPSNELKLPPPSATQDRERIPLSRWDKLILACLMVFALALPPTAFALRFHPLPARANAGYVIRHFLIDYNYVFAGYAATLNLSYLALVVLSGVELRRQVARWRLRDERFLFESGVLPTVTILAPAFNEATTVVESVRSLLTLRYPDYRIVVINDGSRDDTVEQLITAFDLERTDVRPSARIATAPVRAVYRTDRVPHLLVIDKENGGKADALNTGLNYATSDYVCCIDSDSLLENDSLLALVYPVVGDEREVVAVGGNILPVNGCTVAHGYIRSIEPPTTTLGVMQTIEYLRSFICGRMGWSLLNAMLIISGAFGLFKRDRVLEIGGYLTGTGAYRKDTVGEDMELVVRLVHHMREANRLFAVKYAHNANCWTEVPERWDSLLKQRDRWHRGLIEILSYHRRMVFNPRYRSVGLVAMPYLFLFELIGPFFELIGFVVVAVCLLFGLLSLQIVAILFVATVLLGMLVSVSSLAFAEHGVIYFKGRGLRRVLWAAISENLGRRQFLSIHRSLTYFAYLFRNKGWQHFARRGFSPVETPKDGDRQ